MTGDLVCCPAEQTRDKPHIKFGGRSVAKTAFALGRRIQRAGYPEAVQQLKLRTQTLLGLSDDVTISVSELSCREPGCPDVETIVAILRVGEMPTIVRLHKSIPDVTLHELKAAFELALVSNGR